MTMKRSEFLNALARATRVAKAYGSGGQKAALESLIKSGLAKEGDDREVNPILQAVVQTAFGPEDYYTLRTAEEAAWEHYEEKERVKSAIPGFAPSLQQTSPGGQEHETQASSVHSDHGYGYGV